MLRCTPRPPHTHAKMHKHTEESLDFFKPSMIFVPSGLRPMVPFMFIDYNAVSTVQWGLREKERAGEDDSPQDMLIFNLPTLNTPPTHTHHSLHAQNSTSGAEMLSPVCLPAGIAGVALFLVFIAILNLYLTPLLPSSPVFSLYLSLSLPTGSSQWNKVVKVEDADIVWQICECVRTTCSSI